MDRDRCHYLKCVLRMIFTHVHVYCWLTDVILFCKTIENAQYFFIQYLRRLLIHIYLHAHTDRKSVSLVRNCAYLVMNCVSSHNLCVLRMIFTHVHVYCCLTDITLFCKTIENAKYDANRVSVSVTIGFLLP